MDFSNSFYPSALLDYNPNATPALHPDFDVPDQSFNIDLESFAGVDPPHPASLLRRQFSNTNNHFEDVFSETVSNYDQQLPPDQPLQETKTPPLDNEDPRLSFSGPDFHYTLLDYAYRPAPVTLHAQLNGMFFPSVQDSPIHEEAELDPTTRSVTCYRRNLFGISGSISLPRSLRYISTEHGEQIPIISTEVSLSATESMEGAIVKLISVPFKSSNAPPELDDRLDKDPANIPIDLITGSEMDPGPATFPTTWKRLQFRASTANNGRRKELQQSFTLRASLRALLSNGQQVDLCSITKGPIIVRGRSPRNFQARAATSNSISSRKPGMPRYSTTDGHEGSMPIKAESEYNFNFSDMGVNSDPWNVRSNGHKGAMTALPPDTFRITPQDFLAQSSPDISRYTAQDVPAPVNLSLVEDGTKRPSANPGAEAKRQKVPRLPALKRPPSFSIGTLLGSGTEDDTDPLYEYFPLGLDDWQEPVDAVYRPHVVHHIALPSSKDAIKSRSKRYFSEASPT